MRLSFRALTSVNFWWVASCTTNVRGIREGRLFAIFDSWMSQRRRKLGIDLVV